MNNNNITYTTNDTVRGYVIIAMKQLGYKKEDIEKVIDKLYSVFDTVSEEEAQKLSCDPFKYDDIK